MHIRAGIHTRLTNPSVPPTSSLRLSISPSLPPSLIIFPMSGLFAGTPLERPVTCEFCGKPLADCICPRDAEGNVLPPSRQTAVIRIEKRRRGKTVTTVSGLDPVASDLPAILKQLKSTCAAGGTVSHTGDMVEIQGDHRERIAAMLTEMGYKTRVIG